MRSRLVIGALLIGVLGGRLAAQQPAGPQAQPGLKWSDEQIRKTAGHVRAGRKLTPKTWPNGARVAVCLSVDPDNFSIALNAGNTNPVAISVGEYGALDGMPRMLKLFDKHNIPVVVLHSRGRGDDAPGNDPGDQQAEAPRGCHPRMDSREPDGRWTIPSRSGG